MRLFLYTSHGDSAGKSTICLCTLAYLLEKKKGNNFPNGKILVFDANTNNSDIGQRWLARFNGDEFIFEPEEGSFTLEDGSEIHVKFYDLCDDNVIVVYFDKEKNDASVVWPNIFAALNSILAGNVSTNFPRLNSVSDILVDTNQSIDNLVRGIPNEIKFDLDRCYPVIVWTPRALYDPKELRLAKKRVDVLQQKCSPLEVIHVLNPKLEQPPTEEDIEKNKSSGRLVSIVKALLQGQIKLESAIINYVDYRAYTPNGSITMSDFVETMLVDLVGQGRRPPNIDDTETSKDTHESIGEDFLDAFIESEKRDGRPQSHRYRNICLITHYDATLYGLKNQKNRRTRLFEEASTFAENDDRKCRLEGLSHAIGYVYKDIEFYFTNWLD